MRRGAAALAVLIGVLSACGSTNPPAGSPTAGSSGTPAGSSGTMPTDGTMPMDGAMVSDDHSMGGRSLATKDRVAIQLATARFQDVDAAESAGYASSLNTLGCFQNAQQGGMGVHYINQTLMDAKADMAKPEALVYELDGHGKIAGLVALEYIVPLDAWTAKQPPSLFGLSFHQHPTLPLWVLHVWLWKDNAAGVFQDWNPAVWLCPAGVPIFGVDLPRPPDPPATTTAGQVDKTAGRSGAARTGIR